MEGGKNYRLPFIIKSKKLSATIEYGIDDAFVPFIVKSFIDKI